MELVNVALARATVVVDMAELNNRGLRIYPDLLERIREKYEFDEEADPSKLENRYKLFNGVYRANHGNVTAVLQVFSDGLWAETTSNTTDAEAFLNDLLNWAKTDLGMNYQPGVIKGRAYQSELVVRSTINLGVICDKFARFAGRLSSIPFHGKAKQQQVVTINFGADGDPTANFTFDRRAGVPFSESKYYCRAPLQTDEHFKLLQEFETIMLS